MKWKSLGLVLVALTCLGVASSIEPGCVQKVGQVLCSIHHPDNLSLCLRGVNEKTVFWNQGIASYCFTEDPDHCVTEKLCSLKVNDGDKERTTTTTTTTTTRTTASAPQPQVTFSHKVLIFWATS